MVILDKSNLPSCLTNLLLMGQWIKGSWLGYDWRVSLWICLSLGMFLAGWSCMLGIDRKVDTAPTVYICTTIARSSNGYILSYLSD